MSTKPKGKPARGGSKAPSRRSRPLLRLVLPTLILLPLVLLSTFWRVPTRIQLDLTTTRLALTLAGEEPREILNHPVAFSALTIEDCNTVTFHAEKLEIADPSRPAEPWRELTPTDPIQLVCRDPAAKLTLQNPDPATAQLGTLADIRIAPGAQVILEISSDPDPALTFELTTRQQLTLALAPTIELVTDLLKPEGIDLPLQANPLTFRAHLPESRRMLDLTGSEHGLVLVLTPPPNQLGGLFREKLDLPLTSIQLLEEDLGGELETSLRDTATLKYPEYPTISAVEIAQHEVIDLNGLTKTRLHHLEITTSGERAALHATLEGIAEHAKTRAGDFVTDHRLTLFHTFRYSWRWEALVVFALWLIPTTWAAYEVWK